MRAFVAILFLAAPLWAHKSLNTNSAQGTVTITPVQNDQHWDVRIHNITPPSGTQYFYYMGGFELEMDASGNVYLYDNVDTFTGLNNYVLIAKPAGSSDFMVRAQRCTESDTTCTWVGGPWLMIEVWNIDGTGWNSAISPITTINSISSGLTLIGNPGNLTADVAYVRHCAGVTPMNTNVAPTIPPYPNGNAAQASCTVIGDWELENNGTDSGSHGYNLSGLGAATYDNTPTPAPGCVLPATTFSTAFTATVSAVYCGSTQDTSTLTYAWTYLGAGSDGVTQTPTFTTASAVTSAVTGLARGSFNIQAAVTDTAAQTTNAQVHDGVVVTDSSHVVHSMGTANIDQYYMPMIQWGQNPYPYFDNQAKVLADYFGAQQSGLFLDTWMTPVMSGTVYGANGASSLTIGGVNAQTIFCGGGSSGGSTYIIVYNVISAVTYHSQYAVTGCPNSTTVNISPNYRDATISSGSPVAFSYMLQSSSAQGGDATWINSSNNANYYDNVVAFMAMYYRTGIDTYYTYGHTLGTRWWTMPWINQGLSCDTGGSYPCMATVSARDSTLGLLTLYLDGTIPTFLAQTEINWQAYDKFFVQTSGTLGDLRVDNILLARLAYWTQYETGSNQTTAHTALVNGLTYLTGLQQSNGFIPNLTNGYSPWNSGAIGTVTTSNVSPTVTGAGTNFTSGQISNNYFITVGTNAPTCTAGDNWDTLAYWQPVTNSTTSITLQTPTFPQTSTNYAGGFPGAGRYFQSNNVVGCTEQPFIAGFSTRVMNYAYQSLTGYGDSTNAAAAKTILSKNSSWIENVGFAQTSASPAPAGLTVNGIFYARGGPESEPNPWNDQNNWCLPIGVNNCTTLGALQGARNIATEIMAGLAFARGLGDTSSVPATIYAALYGGLGGVGSDANYIAEFIGGPANPLADYNNGGPKAKDFGFVYGLGNGAMLPAIQILTTSSGSLRSNSLVGGPTLAQ